MISESLDDYVSDTSPIRVVDVFVDELDLKAPVASGLPKKVAFQHPYNHLR